MYPLIISIFLLAAGLMLPASFTLSNSVEQQKLKGVAANYCVYREAVAAYLKDNVIVGNIPAGDLPLPPGYVALGNWQARVVGDYCYVFGTAPSHEVFYQVRRILKNSVLTGENRNGVIFPSGIELPAGNGIPNGVIISLVSVQ